MAALRFLRRSGRQCAVLHSILAATLAFTAPAPGQTLEQSVQSPRQVRALSLSIPVACMSLVLDVYISDTADYGGGEAAAADAEESLGYGGVFDGVHVSSPPSPFFDVP